MAVGKVDIGFTHVALVCTDAERTIDFYGRYAGMTVIHDRRGTQEGSNRVFWLSDLKRPFAIVFLEARKAEAPLGPFGHLGVCLASRGEVDELVSLAKSEARKVQGPKDDGPPVGYWAFIEDPDGNTLEVSYGQELQVATEAAASRQAPG